ncbi:MAG: hypothetical protein M1833_006613 [Piccolia ochrophora]|nr:MAG: hypothetical protein M1833_006613 [Piccolia ochrophora]
MAPPAKRRKKSAPTVEEISFNPEAREEYLTGFHKRKVQRIKHSQELAAKKERADKLEERRQLREDRKLEAQKHVDTVNAMIQAADGVVYAEIDTTDTESKDGGGWEGFEEQPNDIALAREDEYLDEDRHTTVTVEAVDISRDGLRTITREDGVTDGEGEGDGDSGALRGPAKAKQPSNGSAAKSAAAKDRPTKPKKKRKKFRYENKADRKTTRQKERAGNKAGRIARKS